MANNGYVVGIGAANVDIFGKSKNNLIPEDSNPGYISVSVGGVTHNMCTNASKLGLDVYLITTVGDDGYGKMITEDCQQNGIHTDHFFTLPGNVSSTYISLHNNNGEMALAVSDMHILQKLTPEMLEALQPEEVEEEHSIVVSEQVDRFDENGKWCGTDELSVPVSETNCERPNRKSFYCWLCALYPQYDWQYDDGEDWDENPDTDYCQYTAQIDKADPSHIYLAVYNRTKKEEA